jgi:hypothetical protein
MRGREDSVLSEIPDVRQIEHEGKRRWFRDEELDLIVWYRDNGSIDGFQLCYDKSTRERAFTWHSPDRYQHHAIDDGEGGGMVTKMTPVLVADGVFDSKRIGEIFASRSGSLPMEIVELVSLAIERYGRQ